VSPCAIRFQTHSTYSSGLNFAVQTMGKYMGEMGRGGFAEGTHLMTRARTSGHCVVLYGLEICALRAGASLHLSHC